MVGQRTVMGRWGNMCDIAHFGTRAVEYGTHLFLTQLMRIKGRHE